MKPDFDPVKHIYRMKGRVIPGVTDPMANVLGINPYWTDAGRDFGTKMHLAIALCAQKDLDYATLDERLKPRVDAYEKFCLDFQFVPDVIEQMFYSVSPEFCGTPDQAKIGQLVVDFKKGKHLPEHALQLAAYAHLLGNSYLYERIGVELRADGKYSITPYKKQDIRSDFNIFISILNVYNWRTRNGSRTRSSAGIARESGNCENVA